MRTEIFNSANGDRPNITNVAVLITGGIPTREVDELYNEASLIKNRGIVIVGVGVTRAVSVSVFLGLPWPIRPWH